MGWDIVLIVYDCVPSLIVICILRSYRCPCSSSRAVESSGARHLALAPHHNRPRLRLWRRRSPRACELV